jgi:small neutral amino acid transporter SnatA (MarC family)
MKELLQRLFTLGIGACRIAVGLLVIKAGFELIQKQGSFTFWSTESSITGIFVIVLGAAFVVLGIFPNVLDR